MELPLNGRNFSDLALLATNVHRSIYAYAVPPREGAFNANGFRSTYNNFMLDGVDNNAYSTSNQGFSNQVAQPSPDAIAEFKVITSNYSAEYGRVGGAVVNAAMRSGTNQIHGTAYEFLRNTTSTPSASSSFHRPSSFRSPRCSATNSALRSAVRLSRTSFSSLPIMKAIVHCSMTLTFDTIPTVAERNGVCPARREPGHRGGLSGEHADSDLEHQSVRRQSPEPSSRSQPARDAPTTIRPCC